MATPNVAASVKTLTKQTESAEAANCVVREEANADLGRF